MHIMDDWKLKARTIVRLKRNHNMFVFYFFILTIRPMLLQSDVSKFKFCERSKSDELRFACLFLGWGRLQVTRHIQYCYKSIVELLILILLLCRSYLHKSYVLFLSIYKKIHSTIHSCRRCLQSKQRRHSVTQGSGNFDTKFFTQAGDIHMEIISVILNLFIQLVFKCKIV